MCPTKQTFLIQKKNCSKHNRFFVLTISRSKTLFLDYTLLKKHLQFFASLNSPFWNKNVSYYQMCAPKRTSLLHKLSLVTQVHQKTEDFYNKYHQNEINAPGMKLLDFMLLISCYKGEPTFKGI